MMIQSYEKYLCEEQQMLISLDSECQDSRSFEHVYREFEAQKVCYLPVNAFLLKPAQRLLHYQLIINSQSTTIDFLITLYHSLSADLNTLHHPRPHCESPQTL